MTHGPCAVDEVVEVVCSDPSRRGVCVRFGLVGGASGRAGSPTARRSRPAIAKPWFVDHALGQPTGRSLSHEKVTTHVHRWPPKDNAAGPATPAPAPGPGRSMAFAPYDPGPCGSSPGAGTRPVPGIAAAQLARQRRVLLFSVGWPLASLLRTGAPVGYGNGDAPSALRELGATPLHASPFSPGASVLPLQPEVHQQLPADRSHRIRMPPAKNDRGFEHAGWSQQGQNGRRLTVTPDGLPSQAVS